MFLGKLFIIYPVIIEEYGLQPDDVTCLNDNSSYTCSVFLEKNRPYTQIFEQAVCDNEQMSVTLMGNQMNCDENIYVVGLTESDVGKSVNRWKTSSENHAELCNYDCHCTGRCE